MSVFYYSVVSFCLGLLGWSAISTDAHNWILTVATGLGLACHLGLLLESFRPKPLIQKVGDTIRGVYLPEGKTNPDLTAFVGSVNVWTAIYKIDKGPYKGDWAMALLSSARNPARPFNEDGTGSIGPLDAWVPIRDLIVQERRRTALFSFQ